MVRELLDAACSDQAPNDAACLALGGLYAYGGYLTPKRGRAAVKIFDAGWSPPALFAPGDKIVFEPIGLAAFHELRDAVEHDGYRIEARALAE